MRLYLLRHAEAEVEAASDRARRLTPKGKDQAERVGKFCREQGIEPAMILSSPVTRALQTAKAVAGQLPGAELAEVSWAACGMDPWTAMEELSAFAKLPTVMLVGHQPDLGALASVLLGMDNVQALHVRKALLMAIDAPHGIGERRGVLQFFVPVKLM
jgi:phosphohistidine phosphatase